MRDEGQTALRILDAAGNRVTEGLRTIEEAVRFGLDDESLAGDLKRLRHETAAALLRLPREALLTARDTESDVGTTIETASELTRVSIADVVRAAIERVQQSYRVLEEYGKTIDVEFAQAIQAIRYRAYTLHQRVELRLSNDDRHRRLLAGKLYALLDCGDQEQHFAEVIRELATAGVDIFQLRDKQATDRTLFERSCVGAETARRHGALFIVNDRPDIALAADADGVHVGQDELPVHAVRRVVGSHRIVGVSTHDVDQVRKAIDAGADYIGCGPTFPSRTKSFANYSGIAFLHQAAKVTSEGHVPAFAIGGITLENLSDVLGSGFDRIAVSAAISQSNDPSAVARQLKQHLVAAAPEVKTPQD